MSSKQARPHSPAGTRLEGPDAGGIYRIIVPSESRPGRAHELRVLYTGEAVGCTCEGHAAFLDYRATRHTPGTPLARRDCWHMEAAADLLAHHLDPPPADPGGAALDAAQADADDETDAWEAELRKVRHDEGLRALYGPS
jgi:hypothetical protein